MGQINLHKIKWNKIFISILVIIILFLATSLFVGCGSIKKAKEETSVEASKESTTDSKLTYNKDSFTLSPVDLEKPILISNKEGQKEYYYNTIIKHEKESGVKEESKNEKEEVDIETSKKDKESDNTMLIIGVAVVLFFFLLLVIVFVVIYFSSQIKSLIPKN